MGSGSKDVGKSKHSSRSESDSTGSSARRNISRQKATFENLITELQDGRYARGVDAASTIDMLASVYNWLILDPNAQIRVPNAVGEDTKFSRMMWPECAIVRTRTNSGSAAENPLYKEFGTLRVGGSVKSSVVSDSSSVYRPINVHMIPEDDDVGHQMRHNPIQRAVRQDSYVQPQPIFTPGRSMVNLAAVSNDDSDVDRLTTPQAWNKPRASRSIRVGTAQQARPTPRPPVVFAEDMEA